MENHSRNSAEVMRVTGIGMRWNIILGAFKIIGGVIGNSQAVLADGIHSLSDTVTDLAVLVGAKLWGKPADRDHPYGHGRIETIVTIGIGILLASVSVGLMLSALETLREGETQTPGWLAAIAAGVSVVVKEGLYHWTKYKGKTFTSSALRANAWHHRSDALSSIPALVAVMGAKLLPEGFWILDPIGGIIVSTLILYAGWSIAAPALQSLIDRGKSTDDIERIRSIAMQVKGVQQAHAIRTRSLGEDWHVDLHILVDDNMTVREGHNIAERVNDLLIEQGPAVADTIVYIEPLSSSR